MMAFTPGPWDYHEDGHVTDADNKPLALVRIGVTDLAATFGNLSLMAAAPDLYGVAVDAENAIAGLGHDGGVQHGLCGLCDLVTRLRDALEKARGEQL